MTSKAESNKEKIEKYFQNLKMFIKGKYRYSKKATHIMVENIYKSYIKSVNIQNTYRISKIQQWKQNTWLKMSKELK